MKAKYSLIIRWSDEDQCYIAWVPEFGTGVKTHGDTYAEAATAGAEVIEMLLDSNGDHLSLPTPWLFPEEIEADDRLGKILFPDNAAYRSAMKTHFVKAKNATS